MVFLYYLPGVTKDQVTRESLRGGPLGERLWDLLATPTLFQTRISLHSVFAKGPDGMSGVIVAALPADAAGFAQPIGFYPERQEWHQVGMIGQALAAGSSPVTEQEPAASAVPLTYWIGLDTRSRPTPDGLQREHVVSGAECELGDGGVWVCPLVRRRGFANAMPSTWGIDLQTGAFAPQMLGEYSPAWLAAQRIFDGACSGDIPKAEALTLCGQMLSINYRVGLAELTLLRVLSDATYLQVWRTAIDADFVEDWLAAENPGEGEASKKN